MAAPQAYDTTAELLDLAQQAGRVGVFEWLVPQGEVQLSPQAMKLLGLTDFDGAYDTLFKRIFREDQLRVGHVLETSFSEQAAELQLEFRINASNRPPPWIEARYLIFYGAEAQPMRVVGVLVDITDRKIALAQLHAFRETLEEAVRERTRELEAENEARRKAEESLRQAQKMEAIGQLTGGIAHDFNNLLTIVVGGLDMIGRQLPALSESPTTERISRARDLALEGVQRAITLTRRLLAFSRQQPLVPSPLDVNRLVMGICEFLKPSLGEHVSMETVLAAGLWRAFADPNELENALLNLALNARDAMPDGGKLTIETTNCFLDDAYIAGITEPVDRGQYVLIAVTDTGTGMDKATLARVFDPFFTTKEAGKGTGLGLSQVYGFVRQSSGHVRIYSEVGEGTTVKIYLPRYTGSDVPAERKKESNRPLRAIGAETVLVVEDDPNLREYAAEVLTELGYQVLEAADGGAALAVVRTGAAVDILFTDVVMPGSMNGRQLADAARALRPGLKVLFTTGYTRNAIIHHGRLDPGVELISKPYSAESLAKKLRQVIDGPR